MRCGQWSNSPHYFLWSVSNSNHTKKYKLLPMSRVKTTQWNDLSLCLTPINMFLVSHVPFNSHFTFLSIGDLDTRWVFCNCCCYCDFCYYILLLLYRFSLFGGESITNRPLQSIEFNINSIESITCSASYDISIVNICYK